MHLLVFTKFLFTSAKKGLLYPIFRSQYRIISLTALPGLLSVSINPQFPRWSEFYKTGSWFTALSHYFFAHGYRNLDSAAKWIVCYSLNAVLILLTHPFSFSMHIFLMATFSVVDATLSLNTLFNYNTTNSRERLPRQVNIHVNAETGSWACLGDYWRKRPFSSLEMSEFLDAAAESDQSPTGSQRRGRQTSGLQSRNCEKDNASAPSLHRAALNKVAFCLLSLL